MTFVVTVGRVGGSGQQRSGPVRARGARDRRRRGRCGRADTIRFGGSGSSAQLPVDGAQGDGASDGVDPRFNQGLGTAEAEGEGQDTRGQLNDLGCQGQG